MLIDYHIHNRFSSDSKMTTEEIAKKEMSLGVSEICITNHVETFHPVTGDGIFIYDEAVERFSKIKPDIRKAQKKFPKLPIKFGVELEYLEPHMDDMRRFVEKMDFDFMICSVHVVDKVVISSSDLCGQLYEKVDENYAYTKYFDLLLKTVEWGYFSVIGHFDICKKGGYEFYGPFNPKKYKDRIMAILKTAKQKGIGIELNTKCLHEHCKELFPNPDILKWALDIGIENFTLGSDGHKIDHVGEGLSEALAIAKDVGIKSISTYEKRVPTKFKI
jgi:histidinol-phosphatase (PHP family)